jgi:uncharacterized membrane protein HdeD (DUF308 family)
MQASPHDHAAVEKGRSMLLVSGVLAIGAGLLAIVLPAVASVGMAVFLGWLLVFASGFLLVDAFAMPSFTRTAFRVLLAVVTFAAGLYLLVAPLRGTYTLTVMLVIWFVAQGFTRIAIGIAEHGAPGWGLIVANGVLSLILGILIANHLPESADWAIGLLVGIDLLFYGASAVAAWAGLGRLERGIGGAPPAAA